MSDKGAMIDSGVEWLGNTPEGWKVNRVKDALGFYNTQRIPLSSAERGIMENKKYDYYGASGIIDKVEDYLFDGVYILIGEDGANLLSRSTALAFIAKGKFWVNNHAHILKPRFGNITYFVNFLESMDYSLFVTGAAQPKLTKDNLGKFKILNPPIDEQQKIAAYLDHHCAKLDKVIALKQQQIKTLEALRQSTIYQAVTKGLDDSVPLVDSGVEWLGDIPMGWKIDSLKRLLEERLKYGANEAAELDDITLPRYIRITDFNSDGLLKESSFKSLPFHKADGYYLKDGDVLFARSGATVGKTFIYYSKGNSKACFAGYLIKASTNRHVLLPDFLYFYSKSPAYDMWKTSIFTQATIQNIGADKYAYLPVIVPPLNVQQSIVIHLKQETQRLNTLKENLNQQINTLQAYKKSLIYEMVTGKKRV